jgi:hypothetical protein
VAQGIGPNSNSSTAKKKKKVQKDLWNSGGEGKEKRMIVNNIEIHYICAGRRYAIY